MKGNAKDYVSTAQQFSTAYDAHDVDLTAEAAYPPKTLRAHSWMSWNSRSTLANDSRLGTDN